METEKTSGSFSQTKKSVKVILKSDSYLPIKFVLFAWLKGL